MFKNYIKIAWRNLKKNRVYSVINILGLALGIVSFILITLYVAYEKSYDSFKGSEQVYRVFMDYAEGGEFIPGDAQTYNLTGPTLKKEFPEITKQVRLYRLEKVTFVLGEKVIQQPNGSVADPTYFEIFNQRLLKGKKEDFSKPNSIILTKNLAKKLFGNVDPMNKILSVFYGSEAKLEVVGIVEDVRPNTHLKMNFFISFPTMNTWDAMSGQEELNWNMNNFFTYIKVAENTNFNALQKKIIASDFENDPDERHNIEPLRDIHLYSEKPYEAEANGSISRIRFLSAIALIIIILSWLNYVNLSTVKSMERAKEIGVRKVAGAKKSQLILQSLIESLVLNFIAILLALGLVLLFLPIFNGFVGKAITFGFADFGVLSPYLVIILIGTLASGLYPAFVISGFSPVRALKGKTVASGKSINIRKGLVTLQFFATVVLIVCTIVVGKQIRFLGEQPIGVDLNMVVAVKGEILENQTDSLMAQKTKILNDKLKDLAFVEGVAMSNTFPGDGYDSLSSTVGITYPNGTLDERLLFYIYGAHPEYFDVVDLQFVAGESFLPNGEDIVINEILASTMGYSNPQDIVGKNVKFWGRDWKIAGVIADYHHFGLKDKIAPMIIGPTRGMDNVLIKMNTQDASIAGIQNNLDQIKLKWDEIFPQSTFSYTFLDQKFNDQYSEDRKFGKAFQIFTGLAILIAAMGLFGLTSYTCLQRKKEIGIRKVSGATVMQVLTLLNKDFMKLVGIAFLIAAPISWYIMGKWLQEFAYKTTLNWWIFLLAGILVFVVAVVSISFQAIKTAIANPVKSLRTE